MPPARDQPRDPRGRFRGIGGRGAPPDLSSAASVPAASWEFADVGAGGCTAMSREGSPLARWVARNEGFDLHAVDRSRLDRDRQVIWVAGVMAGSPLTACPRAA